MSDQLIKFDTRRPALGVLMFLTLLLTVVWLWFVVRWYIGNSMAEYLNPGANNLQLARRAVSLAPNDPLTHWRMGEFIREQLSPDHLPEAVSEYEKAVSLAPHDYRLWVSLGTALEQNREIDKAEQALRRAVELAPSYSYPAWYLGNLLLRGERYAEAFAELRRASDADPELRPQLFNLAWEIYNSDFESLKTVVGPKAEARAQFSQYLLQRKRFADGLRIWESLSEDEKRANSQAGKAMITTLLAAHDYHHALTVWNGVLNSSANRLEIGSILDGGFEDANSQEAESGFGWQVKSGPHLQIGIDPNDGKTGHRSLRLLFQVNSKLDKVNMSQLVPVQPATEYEFECFVKTKKLQTVAPPIIEIVDAVGGGVLASTGAAPVEEKDWQQLHAAFKSGDKTQAVIIRLNRASCEVENSICPIYGTVWYDDFSLTRRN